MEKSEPSLVPEWLKGTGSVTGGGSASHHSASSSSHSDESSVALPTKNRSSLNVVDYDSPRSSALLERTSSAYFRRSSSSNGSMGHDKDNSSHSRAYSSFGRSYRDREWDKDILNIREKDRSSLRDKRDRDYFDTDVFTSRIEKDMFRRSQSMISGKRAEVRPRRVVAVDSNNYTNNNGVTGGSKLINIHKGTFERDFPSLGAEEKHGVDRVASPGLSIAAQSLPMSTSAAIMGNGWTSALAEVPAVTGSNNMGLSSAPQTAASSLGSLPPSTTGLNMAETVAQAPLKARTAPQLSLETQRLEELAIKQSRQLIPMTPSMSKNSVSNLEKQKPKVSARSEMSMGSKIGQQPLLTSQPANHHIRGGVAKPDVSKTSNGGKLLVLKAARENGISLVVKEGSSPTNAGRVVSNPLGAVPPSVGSVPTRSVNNPKAAAVERKATSMPVNKVVSMEKKPINSQAQSRNDFFNLVRKKTLSNNSSGTADPGPIPSPTMSEKSGEITSMVSSAVGPQGSNTCVSEDSSLNADHGAVAASNGDAYEDSQGLQKNGEKHSNSDASLDPDEEEAAFLRSLGWEEDAGEEEGLTEEEINAFYQEYVKLRPSSKLCKGMCVPKLPLQSESHVGGSGQSSSESKSEA